MSKVYLDRDEASKTLKVSTRTLDRYIRKYRIKTRKDGRRILIRRSDVDRIIEDHVGQFIDIKSTEINRNMDNNNVDNESSNMSKIAVKNIQVENIKNENGIKNIENDIYKDLYTESKKELKEKQERLEGATYRVGQLETQLKNTVPLLDFTRKEKELRETHIALEQKAMEGQEVIKKMGEKVRNERVAKWLYLSIVGFLLVVEPLIFLFWAFS